MAKLKGLDDLKSQIEHAKDSDLRAGIQAEIEVAELLEKKFTDETYIICKPSIGTTKPDFLIISPDFGFRIIEIKNLSLRRISEINSNGIIKYSKQDKNPYSQVENQVEDLNIYLANNHSNFKNKNLYETIGFCVVFMGFDFFEFEQKFSDTLNSWKNGREDYFKFYLFRDQFKNDENGQLIINAIKYKVQKPRLTDDQIESIVSKVSLEPFELDKHYFMDKFEEQSEMFISKISEKDDSSYVLSGTNANAEIKPSNKINKNWILLSIGIIIFFILGVFWMSGSSFDSIFSDITANDEIVVEDFLKIDSNSLGQKIKIQANVDDFYYSEGSDTKFLRLSDQDNNLIDGIIFSKTKVPFISEGSEYTFNGYFQNNPENTEIEFVVDSIETN